MNLMHIINRRWEDGARTKRRPPDDWDYREENLKNSIREYLRNHSPEELQKVVNDLVTENVIDA